MHHARRSERTAVCVTASRTPAPWSLCSCSLEKWDGGRDLIWAGRHEDASNRKICFFSEVGRCWCCQLQRTTNRVEAWKTESWCAAATQCAGAFKATDFVPLSSLTQVSGRKSHFAGSHPAIAYLPRFRLFAVLGPVCGSRKKARATENDESQIQKPQTAAMRYCALWLIMRTILADALVEL
jgi:hypothetical protein